MNTPATPWEQFEDSARFLEEGFAKEGWTPEAALARFQARYGVAGSLQSLRLWRRRRLAVQGWRDVVELAVAGAEGGGAALQPGAQPGHPPAFKPLAMLLTDLALGLAARVRTDLAGGELEPAEDATSHSLRMIASLTRAAIMADQAARPRDRAAEQRGLAGDDDGPTEHVITPDTLAKIERELGLL